MRTLQNHIAGHLDRLVSIATSNTAWAVNNAVGDVVTAMARDINVRLSLLGELAGKASNQALVISRPGGSKGRVSVAYRPLDQDTPVLFVAGCFKGTGEELLQLSEKTHKPGTQENLHYVNFKETAERLLASPHHLRPLADVIRARVADLTA